MALTDIYQLRWRTEQAGVVMNNGIYYRQIDANTGSHANGAQALVQCLVPGNENVVTWWQKFASDQAALTCGIAEKIEDNSGTGDEQSILFGQTWTGSVSEALSPSQQWCFQMWATHPTGYETSWRNLYIGGLRATALTTIFVNVNDFTMAMQDQHWLLQPRFVPAPQDPSFQAVLSYKTGEVIDGWSPVSRLNPEAFLSRKNSRRLSLCV